MCATAALRVRDVGRVQNQHWSVREPTAQSRHRLRLLEAKRKRIRSILDFCSGSGIEEVKPRVAYLGRLRRRRRERGPSVVVPRWLSEPNPTHSDYQGPDQESAAVTKQKCFFNDRRITPSFFFAAGANVFVVFFVFASLVFMALEFWRARVRCLDI